MPLVCRLAGIRCPCVSGSGSCAAVVQALTFTSMSLMREPYVGTGIDGALRSAQIDESEADTLDRHDPRREDVLESARRWREQAAVLAKSESSALDPDAAEDAILEAAALYDQDETFRRQVDGQ